MDCDQALTELEAYLDGELVEEARRLVQVHLEGCSPCFQRSEFRARLRLIVRAKCSTVAELPPEVADRIRGTIASGD
jgi:anti-sigma factor (TIGR02949 family)